MLPANKNARKTNRCNYFVPKTSLQLENENGLRNDNVNDDLIQTTSILYLALLGTQRYSMFMIASSFRRALLVRNVPF